MISVTNYEELMHALANDADEVFIATDILEIDKVITISKSVHLFGDKHNYSVIKLKSKSNCHIISCDGCDGVNIENLVFDGGTEQDKPESVKSLTYACALYFKKCNNILVNNCKAINVKQAAIHLNNCNGVEITNFSAVNIGWSGLSTTNTNKLSAECMIYNSGLDVCHSAIHLDGGEGVFIRALISKCVGNGIMLDSDNGELKNIQINCSVSDCLCGVSVSGKYEAIIKDVIIEGTISCNRHCGVRISNAERIVVRDSTIINNLEYGILLQGKIGAKKCIIENCKLLNNNTEIYEKDNSSDNLFKNNNYEIGGKIAHKNTTDNIYFNSYSSNFRCAHDWSPLDNYIYDWEKVLKQNISEGEREKIKFTGYCVSCKKDVQFYVGVGRSLREDLRCPYCKLNNRMRLMVEKTLKYCDCKNDAVYMYEYLTPNYKILKNKIKNICGSEYLGSEFKSGYVNEQGVLHEDATDLSFPANNFDCLVSMDVFEHVFDIEKALSESYRVLKNRGKLLCSVPFNPRQNKTIVCAELINGEIKYNETPHYHLNPTGDDSLVTYKYGWDILDKAKSVGFVDAYFERDYSPKRGIIGADLMWTMICVK